MEHNFNKHNLVVGQTVVLDGKYNVILLRLSKPNGMFSSVYSMDSSPKYFWAVMTKRLEPVQELPKEKSDLEFVYDGFKKRLNWIKSFDGLSDFEKGRIEELNNTIVVIEQLLLKISVK